MGKPAVGAGAGAALRKEAEAALRLEREGRHDEALARVDELAGKNTGSALVLHLAGLVHHAAAKRAMAASEKEEAAHHLMTAHDYLAEAKRLVPKCIDISVRLARVLFEAWKHDEAENEVRRAISTSFPVDPAENNVMYSVDARVSTTREQRVESCRESARICFRFFGDWICNQQVPRIVSEVLELETERMKPSHSDETLKADEKFEERLASEAGATAEVLSEVPKTTFTGATCVDPVTTPSARKFNKRNDDSLRWKKPDILFVYAPQVKDQEFPSIAPRQEA